MNRPKMTWEMNANSLVTVGGFVLTWAAALIMGGMTYVSFKTETVQRYLEVQRRIEVLEVRAEANANAIRAGQLQDASNASEMVALRRDLGEIKSELREVVRLLREPQR